MAWIGNDDPIDLFTGVARTLVGRIIFIVLACAAGGALQLSITAILEHLFRDKSIIYYLPLHSTLWDSLVAATMAFPVISLLALSHLYSAPFVLLQLACFYQIIWMECNLLHRWFLIAYSQAFLTYFALETKEWNMTVSFAITLLILGGLHIFLVRLIRRSKIVIGNRKGEEEDADGSPMDN